MITLVCEDPSSLPHPAICPPAVLRGWLEGLAIRLRCGDARAAAELDSAGVSCAALAAVYSQLEAEGYLCPRRIEGVR